MRSLLSRPPVFVASPVSTRLTVQSSRLAAAAHHVAGGQVHGEIALELGIVKEVPLDHFTFVAQSDHKLLESVWAYIFMMCQRIGRPPISTIGFGRVSVSSVNRVPRPPAKMTTFIRIFAVRPTRLAIRAHPARSRRLSGFQKPLIAACDADNSEPSRPRRPTRPSQGVSVGRIRVDANAWLGEIKLLLELDRARKP